jgi:tRNA A-37 threonylcarbamoyl transferase component Bud32/DNA-binding transcriptional ArsR family regulator
MSDTQTLSSASAALDSEAPVRLEAAAPRHLNGRYRLVEFRGAGGAGEVYLGQDTHLDRLVAIKRLRPEVASPEARVQLAHEARINARLEHPHIVRVYDFLSVAGTDFIVSEYVDGSSLSESSGVGLDIDRQLTRALQIIRGLAFAHAAGVVHLDLKPENVLIGRDGVSKIADFGVARRIDAGERHEASGITIRGTFRSMSPEQTRACPADARSDLFSFGTLLYELFAGLSPFYARGHAAETIRRIRELRPLPLRELRPEVPAALSELVQRLHHKELADRPESAREVEAILGELIERRARRPSAGVQEPALERRVLSILSCELAIDAPSAFEQCESYVRTVSRFQQLAASLAERSEGQVLSAVGHGVMMCLGYPRAHDNNCERAAHLLLDLRRAWSQDALGESATLRAGLDVGDTLLSGAIAAGPPLQLAAALCQAAAPGEFLVSAAAQRILRRFFRFEGRGELCVPRTSGSVLSAHYHELKETSVAEELTRVSSQGPAAAVIGRQRELELLAAAWRASQAGRLDVVFLVGAAGVGKSRLLRSFAERVAASGAEVLSFRTRPEDQYSPFAPFAELLSRKQDGEPPSGVRERRADWPTPAFAAAAPDPFGPASSAGVGAGGYRQRIIDAGLAALVGRAGAPPLLLIVEDVHWLDHSSLALLSSLRTQRTLRPLLLVLSGRPECQREVSAALPIQPVAVSRLNARDALELVRAMPGGRQLSHRMAARIVEAADGLPLLLEELTLSVTEPLASGTAPQRFLDVPSSLTESLDRRLEGLGRARDTVDLLAALGRESVASILEKLSGLEPSELALHLSRLSAAGLVFEQGVGPERTIVFRHRLLGDAIYERLPPARREQLHRRIADVVQVSFKAWLVERPDLFVCHFARAGRWLEAVELSVRAGERAARGSCHFEACAHFRGALDLLNSCGLTQEQKQLRHNHIERLLCPSLNANNEIGTPQGSAAEPALTVQRAASQPLTELWAAFAYASLRHDALLVSEILARLAALEASPSRDCVLALAHGHVEFYRGEFLRAEQRLGSAQRMLAAPEVRRVVGGCGQELLIDAACYLSILYSLRGDFRRATEQQRQAEQAARGLPLARGFCVFFATARGLLLREHDSARGLRLQRARVEELVAIAERLHHPIFHAMAEMALGRLEHASDAEEEGLIRMRRGYDLYEETGAQLSLAQFAGFVAEAHLEAHQVAAARELLERVRPAASHAYARFYRPELLRIEAEVLCAEGRSDDARELLDLVTRARAASDLGSEPVLFSQRMAATLARLDPASKLALH